MWSSAGGSRKCFFALFFPKIKQGFCRRAARSFHAAPSWIPHCSPGLELELCPSRPWSGWNQRLHCKSFADLPFLYSTQEDSVLVTLLNNSLNRSCFLKLSSLFLMDFSPCWSGAHLGIGVLQEVQHFSVSGRHFTPGNYLRFFWEPLDSR